MNIVNVYNVSLERYTCVYILIIDLLDAYKLVLQYRFGANVNKMLPLSRFLFVTLYALTVCMCVRDINIYILH